MTPSFSRRAPVVSSRGAVKKSRASRRPPRGRLAAGSMVDTSGRGGRFGASRGVFDRAMPHGGLRTGSGAEFPGKALLCRCQSGIVAQGPPFLAHSSFRPSGPWGPRFSMLHPSLIHAVRQMCARGRGAFRRCRHPGRPRLAVDQPSGVFAGRLDARPGRAAPRPGAGWPGGHNWFRIAWCHSFFTAYPSFPTSTRCPRRCAKPWPDGRLFRRRSQGQKWGGAAWTSKYREGRWSDCWASNRCRNNRRRLVAPAGCGNARACCHRRHRIDRTPSTRRAPMVPDRF